MLQLGLPMITRCGIIVIISCRLSSFFFQMKFNKELMFLVNKPQSFLEAPVYADVSQRPYNRHLQEDPYQNQTEILFFNCVISQCSKGKGLELGLFKLYISGNVDLFLRLCFCFYKKEIIISVLVTPRGVFMNQHVCVCIISRFKIHLHCSLQI